MKLRLPAWSTVPAVVAVLIMLSGVAGSASGAPLVRQSAPPDEVLAALPLGAEVASALSGDLRGDGALVWVALYTAGRPEGAFARDAHVAVIAPAAAGWQVVADVTTEWANGGEIELVPVDGRAAVMFQAFVGAHAANITVVRWDGSAYATVLDAGTDTAGIVVRDADDDGAPDVLVPRSTACGAYAVSPMLRTVYRWDGVHFVDATNRYPSVLADDAAWIRRALDLPAFDARGRACLYDALALIAALGGDGDGVAAACALARDNDPDYAFRWSGAVCG